jgi:hypothetical protein
MVDVHSSSQGRRVEEHSSIFNDQRAIQIPQTHMCTTCVVGK